MVKPKSLVRNIMSREAYEESYEAWAEEMFGKGPADPDRIGHYPGQEDE